MTVTHFVIETLRRSWARMDYLRNVRFISYLDFQMGFFYQLPTKVRHHLFLFLFLPFFCFTYSDIIWNEVAMTTAAAVVVVVVVKVLENFQNSECNQFIQQHHYSQGHQCMSNKTKTKTYFVHTIIRRRTEWSHICGG